MINSIAGQDKLDAYCKETYQSFVKDDSKMVESVNKHRKEPFPAELQFAFVRLAVDCAVGPRIFIIYSK